MGDNREQQMAGHTIASIWERYALMRSRESQGTATYRARGRILQQDPAWVHRDVAQRGHPYLHQPARRPEKRTLDYYELLGVSRNTPVKELERAYRHHVTAIHPDKCFNDPQRSELAHDLLKVLNSAMAVLRDPLQRARYDACLRGGHPSTTPLASRLRSTAGSAREVPNGHHRET